MERDKILNLVDKIVIGGVVSDTLIPAQSFGPYYYLLRVSKSSSHMGSAITFAALCV